jgi:hypothetical protein
MIGIKTLWMKTIDLKMHPLGIWAAVLACVLLFSAGAAFHHQILEAGPQCHEWSGESFIAYVQGERGRAGYYALDFICSLVLLWICAYIAFSKKNADIFVEFGKRYPWTGALIFLDIALGLRCFMYIFLGILLWGNHAVYGCGLFGMFLDDKSRQSLRSLRERPVRFVMMCAAAFAPVMLVLHLLFLRKDIHVPGIIYDLLMKKPLGYMLGAGADSTYNTEALLVLACLLCMVIILRLFFIYRRDKTLFTEFARRSPVVAIVFTLAALFVWFEFFELSCSVIVNLPESLSVCARGYSLIRPY